MLHFRKGVPSHRMGCVEIFTLLVGKPFILLADHQPLTFLNDARFSNDRIMQKTLALEGYDYTVKLNLSGKRQYDDGLS